MPGSLLRSLPGGLFAFATVLSAADQPSPVAVAPDHWFPFHVSALPVADGSLIDRSGLTSRPAGADGPARIVEGRLVDGAGRPLRLFATNLTDSHVLPEAATGAAVAKRFRQLGFNAVRLHYADFTTAAEGGLMSAVGSDQPDPAALDRLDRFAAELKANGIWIDLNLHVARLYAGQPSQFHLGKGIDRVHEPYLESQRHYAKALLDHVNPYTGVRWADEPAVVLVELNNENTAVSIGIDAWGGLADEFRLPLQAAWNRWLGLRYGSTLALATAWNPSSPIAPAGTDLLRDAACERLGHDWVLETSGDAVLERISGPDGAPGLHWLAEKPGAHAWSLQLHQPSVPAVHGQDYLLCGWIRSDAPRTVDIRLMHQQEPWTTVACGSVAATSGWLPLGVGLSVDNPGNAPLRLSLNLGNQPGSLSLAGLSLRRGSLPGLAKGQSIEDGSVPLPRDGASRQRATDLRQFIADREREGSVALRRYLREDLRCAHLLIDSQVNYGGGAGLRRELAVSDVIDTHGYPSHPRDADGKLHWRIATRSLAQPGYLDEMAFWRVAGRPFTVTEFDLNPTNDCAAESVVGLTAMASLQGWDGIFDYCWLGWSPGDWDPKRLIHPFTTPGFAPQMVSLPGMATAYRLGLIPEHQQTTTIDTGFDRLSPGDTWINGADWFSGKALTGLDPWRTRIALQPTFRAGEPQVLDPPAALDDGRSTEASGAVVMDRRDPTRPRLTLAAPAVRLAFGAITGETLVLDDVSCRVTGDAGNPWATVTVVALDGKPIADSAMVLITTAGRAANRGWTVRDGAIIDWGPGPTVCEPMRSRLGLPGTGWQVSGLSGDGARLGQVPTDAGEFLLEGQPTLWYLAERTAR